MIQKKIVFLGCTPFPYGLASTNRLSSILCSLPEHGWEVEVKSFGPTKFPTHITPTAKEFRRRGEYKGVRYHYTSFSVKASKYKLFRMFSSLWGLMALPFGIKKEKGGVLFITNLTQVHYVLYFKILSLLFNAPIVLFRSEYPFILFKDGKKKNLYKRLIEPWFFKGFEGFALMTHSLMDYFNPLSKSGALFELIPMTVDVNRFTQFTESPFKFKYIAYAGSLSNAKDGVDILIKAFVKIAANHPDYHLVIIGDTTKSGFYDDLLSLVQDRGAEFQYRIHFTGLVDSHLIPTYLTNASVLALARPDSTQAQGGFPTKLGEYLATGNPVVVTSVGEIPFYLEHEKNALLCEPGSVDDFANKLDWVLCNPRGAREIGHAGRDIAQQVFNAKVQGERFSAFLDDFENTCNHVEPMRDI